MREFWGEEREERRVAVELLVLYDVHNGGMRRRDVRRVDVVNMRNAELLHSTVDTGEEMSYTKVKVIDSLLIDDFVRGV